MVTVTNIGEDNATVIIVEKPTKEELDLIEKLKKFDPNQQDWGKPTPSTGDFKNINIPIEAVDDNKDNGRQITLEEYDGRHNMTDEEILDCPFIDEAEKAEAQKRVDAKKDSKKDKPKQNNSTATRSNNGLNFSEQEIERRKKNEGIDW